MHMRMACKSLTTICDMFYANIVLLICLDFYTTQLEITVPAPIEPRFYGTIGVFNCKSISILTNVSAIIMLLTR